MNYIIGFAYEGAGVWRVLYCVPANPEDPAVYHGYGILEVRSPARIEPDTLADPAQVLEHWHARRPARHAFDPDSPLYRQLCRRWAPTTPRRARYAHGLGGD